MKSATELKNLHKRIQTLKDQMQLLSTEVAELEGKPTKTKDETKHIAQLSKLKWNLIYQIRGLEIKFKEMKDVVISEIIN